MHIRRKLIALSVELTDDGRLVVFSSTPGMYLASSDHDAVWRDLGPVLQALMRKNEDWPKRQ